MAMNLTRPIGTVVSDNTPVSKGPMRDLLNDIVSAINAIDPVLAGMLSDMQSRRIASTANSSFAGTTFPPGTTTVLFRNSGNTAIWAKFEGALPAPVPANFQQDQVGQWWERTWQASDIREAMRNAGVFSLRNVAGSANAITATLSDAVVAAGIEPGSDTTVELVPVLANTGTVTLKIGTDSARTVKTETGSAAPAGFLRPGVPVQLRRVNADWRALPSVTSDQLTALRNDVATWDAQEASARANADGYIRAAILATSVSLGTVTLSSNSYSAAIASASADIGGSDIVAGASFWFTPPATNPSSNPDLTVGAFKRGIRRADGSAWPAAGFVPLRPYLLMRSGNTYLVLYGEITRAELDAAQAAPLRSKVTVTDASPSGERNTQNMTAVPAAYRGIAITAIGNAPAQLSAPFTFELMTDATVAGLRQVWHNHDGRQFTARRIDGVWTAWTEQARESRVAALEGTLTGQINALTARIDAQPAIARQRSTNLPQRPAGATYVNWYCWDDPTAVMHPFNDLWFVEDAPETPQPAPASWTWYDTRSGSSGALTIRSVPETVLPITAIDYRLGDENSPWITLPDPTPATHFITNLPQGPSFMTLRYRSAIGEGLPDLVKPATISTGDISVDLTRPGMLLINQLNDWQNFIPGLNIDTRGWKVVDIADYGTPENPIEADPIWRTRITHTNQFVRTGYKGWFPTNQFLRMVITGIDAVQQANEMDGIGLGINATPDTGASSLTAIFSVRGVRLIARENGNIRELARHAEVWPFATPGFELDAEIRRVGNLVLVLANGIDVISHNLSGDPAAAIIGGVPELYGLMAAGGNLAKSAFREVEMGNV